MGRGKDLEQAAAAEIRLAMAMHEPPMTKQALGARIGIAHNSVGRYLSGKRDIPSGVMIDMAEALGLTTVELFRRAYVRIEVSTVQPAD